MSPIKALLLDLDGTLLINDLDVFVPRYFKALIAKVRHLCPPEQFMAALDVGMRAMLHNDGTRGTNAEVFAAAFFPRVGRTPAECQPVFEAFYAGEFESLRRYTAANPDARALVELASRRGYQLAIATQPIFPLVAILARLRWARVGAEEFHYDVISSYESMSACKPHPHFFNTLLARLGRAPEECLMVGDSIEADLPARELGIKTFWINPNGETREAEAPGVPCDAQGTLGDLLTLLKTGRINAF